MFRKVLIANRGEIAVRILRACRDLRVPALAIYSEADRDALHVRLADEAILCGGPRAEDSYLRSDRILEIARERGADAVHPGYGFLSENADFARACAEQGVGFIGPSAEVIATLGDKVLARRAMQMANVPVVPGSADVLTDDQAIAAAHEMGFPVMVKASAGGGGRGLRRVASEDELAPALERARSEAVHSFGDDRIYLEKWLDRPRHIEVQLLADHHGNVVHLFERDCSLQRRHQKLIEEAPAPNLAATLREELGQIAVRAAKATGYTNAGTCEFLLDRSGAAYFLEMNTRIQVEHPVSEMITGMDLVAETIRIAAGEALTVAQEDLVPRGAAIELRINAEDPDKAFAPSPGVVTRYREPQGPGIRVDSGIEAGSRVGIHYDALLAKLIAYGQTRDQALARLARAVGEYQIGGIKTGLPFYGRVLEHPAFQAARYDTGSIEAWLLASDESSTSQGEGVRLALALGGIAEASRMGRAWDRLEVVGSVSPGDGVERQLDIEREPAGGYRIALAGGGASIHLDLSGEGALGYSVIVDGRQYEARVEPGRRRPKAGTALSVEVVLGSRRHRVKLALTCGDETDG